MKTPCCVCGKEIECKWASDKKVLGSLICPDCLKRMREPCCKNPQEKPSVIERLKSIANGDSLKNCTYQIALAEQMTEDNRFVQDQLKALIYVAEKTNEALQEAILDEALPSYALVNRCRMRILKTELNKLFHKEKS